MFEERDIRTLSIKCIVMSYWTWDARHLINAPDPSQFLCSSCVSSGKHHLVTLENIACCLRSALLPLECPRLAGRREITGRPVGPCICEAGRPIGWTLHMWSWQADRWDFAYVNPLADRWDFECEAGRPIGGTLNVKQDGRSVGLYIPEFGMQAGGTLYISSR